MNSGSVVLKELFLEMLLTVVIDTVIITPLLTLLVAIFPSKKHKTYWKRFCRRIPAVSCVVVVRSILHYFFESHLTLNGQFKVAQFLDQSELFCVFFIITPVLCVAFYLLLMLIFNRGKLKAKLKNEQREMKNEPSRYEELLDLSNKVLAEDSTLSDRLKNKCQKVAMSICNIATRFGDEIEQELENNGESVLSRQTARLVDKASFTLCLYSILLLEEKLDDSEVDSIMECRECLLKVFSSKLMESQTTLREQLDKIGTSENAQKVLLEGEITANIAQKYIEQINDIVEMVLL